MNDDAGVLARVLAEETPAVVASWLAGVPSGGAGSADATELRQDATDVLTLIGGTPAGPGPAGEPSSDLRHALARLTSRWTDMGLSPARVAEAILVLKQALFEHIRARVGSNPDRLAAEVWKTTLTIDRLGIWAMEQFQRSSQEVISRQQQELLELSTPVVKLADGILALPLIGTLDSERTQVVMETLLQSIAETGAGFAIIDITGVPTVDTLVAQHLLQTVAAARLMGAECIISGIRPQIAQTIVHLGVTLPDVATKASLADAFSLALRHRGYQIVATA